MRPALVAVLLAMASPVSAAENAAGDAGEGAAAVRAARATYNAAIIAHDVAAVRSVFADGYVGIAGSGGEVIAGGDAMADYFARSFRNPQFVSYVRTPDVVTVAVPAERAMERGHWVGRFRTPAGESRLSGEYFAVWVPTAGGWRLRSESFVTLAREDAPASK